MKNDIKKTLFIVAIVSTLILTVTVLSRVMRTDADRSVVNGLYR